jgi:hypothetical protein
MNIGLIGLPNSGKTTIFNALARLQAEVSSYANSKSEPNKAMLEVADDRVATLSEMYHPKKTTYAVIDDGFDKDDGCDRPGGGSFSQRFGGKPHTSAGSWENRG